MPGRIEFAFGNAPRPRRGIGSCRILVLADLAGDAPRAPLAARAPLPLASGGTDTLAARLAPRLVLPADATLPALTLDFTSVDDFHPDALLARVSLFEEVAAAARRLGGPLQAPAAAPAAAAPPAAPDDSFASLLGGAVGQGLPAQRHTEELIRRLVGDVGTPAPDPRRQVLEVAADLARTRALRALLHQPRFQRLEAAWRGLAWLASNLDTDAGVQITVLDLGRDELVADLLGETPVLPALLSAAAEAGGAFGLIAADFVFAATREDVQVLAGLGGLADALDAPLLGGFDPTLAQAPQRLAGEAPAAVLWQALRQTDGAARLGLALPRLLLRRPFGARSDPIDTFAFEEDSAGAGHEELLWGNPAWGLALLLGRAWTDAEGWDFAPDDSLELDDLPLHVRAVNGERAMQPCAEVFLSESAAEALDALGLMPLISRRDRNAARLYRWRSLAGALRGPWGG